MDTTMIEPSKIQEAATDKKPENMEFQAYLKGNADPKELDRQFQKLHDELFSTYDCCKCNNCCRIYAVALREDETESIAEFLGLSMQAFAERYLFQSSAGGYGIEGPCPFLLPDGKCVIHACKPSVCKGYPYTNQPDKIENLVKVFSITEECPIVYEMIERLKEIYRFSPKAAKRV
jgi:Fe-S-cluster containining protein